MKPLPGAIIFAIVFLLANFAIDRMTGDQSRLFPMVVGAVVAGLVFGLVIHFVGRRKSAD